MKIKNFILSLVIIVAFNFTSCSKSGESTSTVKINLVDAPGKYEKVLVNIIDLQYNRSDDNAGWISFNGFIPPTTNDPFNRIDLTELIAGTSLVLTNEDVESGALKHIRLVLGDNNALVFEGGTQEVALSTPSAQQSGLKINVNTNLEPGFSYNFILDWDVQKSIVEAGGSGTYNLKPVIRMIAEVNSGTIEGRIADTDETTTNLMPIANAVVTVYNDSDTSFVTAISSTYTNKDGNFSLKGLAKGSYKLKVEKDGYTTYTSTSSISVVVGEKTNLETISMSKSS
ncbi:hypothetical protein KCTC32516_00766 [Polaribacter huanghezhanensis]|uniref:DUF4382 domain-containing protein n=1 Tax=Polaribacter huanghezhanensis TaxID=1354726 RepID=UPI002649A71C|nr:DUF4382 domain-containing protein [Polaribacter huanghezhanensis]WKD85426.1 hypothetical protein KCTC32516_00766 [Polaribacter huanghezhanensis]